MVKGLDLFTKHFAGYTEQYVLIGGVATYLHLREAGLSFRATKDLDIVLCTEVLTPEFGQVMWAFIESGGYQLRQESVEPRRFYRFSKATDNHYPYMLEFFARKPEMMTLAQNSTLTPVPIDASVESLSAILLNDDYYDFIHAHKTTHEGLPIVDEPCLIPLKARAWLDLRKRKAEGEKIDSQNIEKHLNDVLRLTQLLLPDVAVPLPSVIADDLQSFIAKVEGELSAALLKSLGIKDQQPDDVLDLLKTVYR